MGAAFFASYAHLDDNKYTKLRDVFDELRERVRAKVGAGDVNRVGFIDLGGVKTGSEWVKALGEQVATCRLFVCFCSNTYFNREISGKEFEAFRIRLTAAASPAGSFLLPVIWDKCTLPVAVQQFSPTHLNLPREYFEDGLCTLARVRRATEYEQAIEALAAAIADAIKHPTPLPPGAHPIDFDGLSSAFDNPGVDAIRVMALCEGQFGWEPDVGFTVRNAVEEATSPDRIRWRQLPHGDVPATTLARTAHDEEPIVIVVPQPVGHWLAILHDLDSVLATRATAPCAIIVGADDVTDAAQPGAADVGQALFPASWKTAVFAATFSQKHRLSLVNRIREAIYGLRAHALTRTSLATIEDQQLEAAARRSGVPTSIPTLAGPEGRQ